MFRNSTVLCKFYFWFKPILCFIAMKNNVNMHTLFLVTIYFKYELILTSKDRTHNSLKKIYLQRYN